MNEQEQIKILHIVHQIETVEDFVKISAADYKITTETGNELLRLLREIKTTALK